ncbi:thioredoxin, mitochondrial isoform X1 [Emys orbicularis]|uniref:thioredoxin, mitochondrial isoform X1 n=2 Tax=Emys orbicularis TaxID=82168 RepID=UPI0031FC370E
MAWADPKCLFPFIIQMAQRLVLRRFLSISPQKLSVPLVSILSKVSAAPCYPRSLVPLTQITVPASIRTFSTTPVCRATFNIQDGSDFQDRVVNSQKPVVVDFHAQWCGPCKILGPRLEKMVAKQQGKVLMAKVDIDDHTDLAIEYKVSAVPTVLAMKNGDVVDKFVGIKDEDQLEAFLKKLIGA